MSAPSDVLSAIYAGKTDDARALAEGRFAEGRFLDACEAAALGDVAALENALDRDGDAISNRSGDGWTPLHLAGFFGQDACAAALLARGASHAVLSHNSTANYPLHAAIAGRTNHALITRLLDAGADPNAVGELDITPLHLAASRGDTALCRELLRRGARADARMTDGQTPADMARARGHEATAAFLEGT